MTDGGYKYPQPVHVNENGVGICAHWDDGVCPECRGQTRRQSLAETAMLGILALHTIQQHDVDVPERAYDLADKMLVEEERRKDKKQERSQHSPVCKPVKG